MKINDLIEVLVNDLAGEGSYRLITGARCELETLADSVARFVMSEVGQAIGRLDLQLETAPDDVADAVMGSLEPTYALVQLLGDLVASLSIAAAQCAERLPR